MNIDPRSAEIEIGALSVERIPSFHHALDVVARERRFLTLLQAPPLNQTREFVLSGQKKGDPRIIAVAAGEVVGWCDIGRHFFPTHAHRGSLGMGIIPAFRGRGLGFRLITKALNEAWSAKFSRVELSVYTDNAPAIALYEKVGFTREGFIRDAICIDSHYRDAIAMAILRRSENSN